jgi:hypothetical protein
MDVVTALLAPDASAPMVITTELPLIVIVAAKRAPAAVWSALSWSSVVPISGSLAVFAALLIVSVSVVPALLSNTVTGWLAPVQPARIEAGAIGSL